MLWYWQNYTPQVAASPRLLGLCAGPRSRENGNFELLVRGWQAFVV
jgi:hypothetical protein